MIHTIDMTLTSEQVGVQLLVIELKQFQRCSNFEKKNEENYSHTKTRHVLIRIVEID